MAVGSGLGFRTAVEEIRTGPPGRSVVHSFRNNLGACGMSEQCPREMLARIGWVNCSPRNRPLLSSLQSRILRGEHGNFGDGKGTCIICEPERPIVPHSRRRNQKAHCRAVGSVS